MPTTPNRASLIWSLVIMVVTSWFIAVVTYRWLMHEFPSSKFVLLMVCGMTVVGALAAFAVSALANFGFRAGPSKLRVSLSAIAWLAVCAATAKWLLNDGADPNRTLIAGAIATVSGLLVGPKPAELILGQWFYRKKVRERLDRPHR